MPQAIEAKVAIVTLQCSGALILGEENSYKPANTGSVFRWATYIDSRDADHYPNPNPNGIERPEFFTDVGLARIYMDISQVYPYPKTLDR